MTRRQFLIPLLLLPVLGVLPGCDRGTSNGSSGDSGTGDIIIGQVASLTGDTATFGVSSSEGLKLALDEINAKGVLNGRKIQVKTEDDRSLPDEAKTATEKLITRDKAVAIIGEIASSRSIAMAPVAQDNKVPMLSPGSTNPKVTEIGDYIFRACFIDPFQGTAVATFAMAPKPEGLGLKRFAILYPVNSDYGMGLREFFGNAVKKAGGKIVADEAYAEKSDVDFRGQLTKIKQSNPTRSSAPATTPRPGSSRSRRASWASTSRSWAATGGTATRRSRSARARRTTASSRTTTPPTRIGPEVKGVRRGVPRRFKNPDGSPKTPDAMAILGYDAMKLMADAINRAWQRTTASKIRDALATTKELPRRSGRHHDRRQAQRPEVAGHPEIKDGKFDYVASVAPTRRAGS
jgi:branched-chain amino acid transport system substrate-binding protein